MANLSNINNKFLVTTGGNVLIGKTAASNATVGTQIMSTGDINPTVSGDTVARFNRLGTDGEIIIFQHDTSTDGAINSLSGRIAIGSGNTGIFFDSIRQVVTPHNMTTNGNEFNNISFGRNLIRFKDVYLSGRVMAGTGTTAAASLNAYTQTVSTNLYSALRIIENSQASSYWDIGATGGGQPDLNFYVNAGTTPKLTIQANGNVGIGATAPNAKLKVEGNAATNGLSIKSAGNGGTYPFMVTWSGGNEGDAFCVNDALNVGIGTNSPDYQLDIENTSGAAVMRLHAAANNSASLRLKNDAVDWDVNCQTNDKFAIYNHTDGTERLVILPTSGDVGIGTASPNAKLAVNGNLRVEGNSSGTSASFGGSGDFAIDGPGVGGGRFIVKHGSGDVGIGVTGPNAKLDVNGALKAQRFFSRNGSLSSTAGNWHNVVDLQQSEYENRTLICSVYTNGTHSYSSATVNVAYNGGSFVLTIGNKINGGSTDIRVSGGYLQYYTPWTSTSNFWRITIN